jgi:hypothetical protein
MKLHEHFNFYVVIRCLQNANFLRHASSVFITPQIVGVTTRLPAVQRLVEIKSVSEQLHFKISTLLLHSGKVTEAVTWFRQHKNTYKRLVGAPEAIFVHWEWMSRQYLVFGELLETSSKTTQNFPPVILGPSSKPLSEWEFYPAYYYQVRTPLEIFSLYYSLHVEKGKRVGHLY